MANHTDRDNFDEIFQQKLASYSQHQDLPAWSDIATKIPKVAPARPYFRYAAIAASLIGVVTFLVAEFAKIGENIDLPPLAQTPKEIIDHYKSDIPASNPPLASIEYLDKNVKTLSELNNTPKGLPNINTTKTTTTTEIHPLQAVVEHLSADNGPVDSTDSEVSKTQENSKKTIKELNNSTNITKANRVNYVQPKRKKLNYTLGLLASNAPTLASQDVVNPVEYLMQSSPSIDSYEDINGAFGQINTRQFLTDFKHNIPLRFGLDFSFYLTDRLSLASGLTYSYLKSDFSRINSTFVDGSQVLHYLGIPIFVQYDVVSKNNFRLYASLGGEFNYNLKTKQNYQTLSDNIERNYVDHSPVWGIGAKAGVAYSFFKGLELYLEPEVSHYMSNSKIHSYWLDNDIVFSVNIGIRTKF